MKDYYHTLYFADYGTVKASMKDLMSFDDARIAGIEYCEEQGHEYCGTFTSDEIDNAEKDLRIIIYGNEISK